MKDNVRVVGCGLNSCDSGQVAAVRSYEQSNEPSGFRIGGKFD
jgi:hypothetical protein